MSGFKVKKIGFIKKTNPLTDKFNFLIANIGIVRNQRFVNAIDSLNKYYKRHKKITDDQELYVDYLVRHVKDQLNVPTT